MKKMVCFLLTAAFILGASGCSSGKSQNTDATSASAVTTDPSASTPPDTGAPSPDTTAQDEPEALPSTIEVGKVRVQLLSDTLVRIEMKGPKGFEDRESFNVIKRTGWDEVPYTTSETDSETVITTADYAVHISKKATRTPTGCYITDSEGNVIWTYIGNTDSNVYLPSPSDQLQSWYFTDTPRVIPSENGYTPSDTDEADNGWDLSNDATDLFVFLPRGSYETFASDFIELTGPSEMVTLQMLGYWDSRWYEYSAETALQQIKDYQDRGYSIDILVIDTDWRTTENGVGYTINKRLFPNMAEFLEQAHEMGVSIMFNDHPEPVSGTDSLLDQKEVEYRNKNLKLILSLGLDIWWYDRNWSVALKEIKDGISIYASGMYAYQWVTEEYYESITDIGEFARRALIMGNVDGIWNGVLTYAPEISAHKYSIQWTGDIGTTNEDLADEIFNAIYGGAVLGLPYVSADIGGHTSSVSDDMYVRWIQFGALSPICRVHCTKPFSRMPWLYGETAEAVTHQYVDMRYRLLPLYYALAHENYETGLPLLRRLDIQYPQYVESSANDEYLLGDYLLIAPLTDSYATSDGFTFTSGGKKGLYGEYFANKSLSGEPKYTQYDETIFFDWSQSGPSRLGLSDKYSIRWSGEVHIGSEDIALRFFADDGIRVWIDDVLIADGWTVYDTHFTSGVLQAGTTHDIMIEYFEDGGYAHIYVTGISNAGVSREVFLPDGEWMDVWTGQTYAGPVTVTVTNPLETSPIFIRMGSVLALADNMVNTGEKDWSHLTLDVYPSISESASTTLYEDDTQTVAYKEGYFRTTKITLTPTGENTVELVVNPAEGSFDGDRAFTSRNYTVRIHGRSDFGELTSITLSGKTLEFQKLAQDPNADPLAIIGGARDSVIYECTFTSDIDKESKLILTFASTEKDGCNSDYNDTAADFTVTVNTLKKAETDVNLSAYGNKDWALFGTVDASSVIRKKSDSHLIGELSSNWELTSFTDNYTISWQDGDIRSVGSSTKGPVSRIDFTTVLKVTPDRTHYQIYLGGFKSLAQITVRDRAGNVRTYTFGDMSTNFYRMIEIDCSSESDTELWITYSLLCGDNITFSAITASDGSVAELDPPETAGNVDSIKIETPYTGTVNLTELGTVDWEYYGKVDNSSADDLVRKAGASDRIQTVFSAGAQLHDDNKAQITWSDGDSVPSATTRHGKNSTSKITLTADIRDCKTLTLLVGVWNATHSLSVYDADGNILDSETVVTAGGDARMALVTIDLTGYDTDSITVEMTAVNSNGGNVSLTGAALK
ncbi:MAG: TIM-barrel domain-containing protein [Eubacteriales bacterium]